MPPTLVLPVITPALRPLSTVPELLPMRPPVFVTVPVTPVALTAFFIVPELSPATPPTLLPPVTMLSL